MELNELVEKYAYEEFITNDILNYPALEGYIFSKDNFSSNIEKWSVGNNNILFISGLSGSGKTTLGKEFEIKYGAKLFKLDGIDHGEDSTNTGVLDRICEDLKVDNLYDLWSSPTEFRAAFIKIFDLLIKYLHTDSKTLYIVEGIQIFNLLDVTKFKNEPLLIKGTSMTKSIMQRYKRNGNGKIEWLKELHDDFPTLLKWYIRCENKLKNFKKEIKNT